jgi:hypothetical protein
MQSEAKRRKEEIKKLTTTAKAQDEIDDASSGPDVRGDELPAETHRREQRLETIARAKKTLEERKAKEAQAKQEAEAPVAQPAAPATKADVKTQTKD